MPKNNKSRRKMEENQLDDVMEMIKQIDLNKNVVEDDNDLESKKEDVMEEDADIEVVAEEITGCMKTPKANSDWEPHIQGIHIPVEGTYIDVERSKSHVIMFCCVLLWENVNQV
ncbi:hypothetical protein Tco_0663903 [Tanacetum coccineum]